jgi:hypothetical protein
VRNDTIDPHPRLDATMDLLEYLNCLPIFKDLEADAAGSG